MAPRKAAELFYRRYPDAAHYEVTLYGSLAATGKGHMTDVAIMQSIPGIQILWEPHVFKPFHPNGMEFRAYDEAGNETARWLVYSVGGGALGTPSDSPLKGENQNSPFKGDLEGLSLTAILRYCESSGKGYWEYVEECEGADIWDYLRLVWQTMVEAVERGIDA